MTELSRSHSAFTQAFTTLQAIALTVTGALPAFLTSALAVQINGDVALGPAGLGIATSTLFAVSGLSARRIGRAVQNRGARFGYAVSAALSAAALCIVALAPSYSVLLAGMAIGGVGNAAAQPAANLLLSEGVHPTRLGIAMGIKQCYIPIASLAGGLAIPTISLVLGWRWAIAIGAAVCAGIAVWGAVSVGRRLREAPERTDQTQTLPKRALFVLTMSGGLAAASATALGVFLVDSAVSAGISPANAGYLLASCSAMSLFIRVGLGWIADRVHGRSLYVVVANLMLTSVAGYLMLGFGGGALFFTGATVAYLGWTWTGLFHLAIVRDSVGSVAAATGFVQTGLAFGAAVGPLSLGLLAESASYRVAWCISAVVGAIAVGLTRYARRIVRVHRGLPVAVHRKQM